MLITSAQNPRVKAAAQLREARDRARQGQIIIDGVREIGRALEGGLTVRTAFVCGEMCCSAETKMLVARLVAAGVERLDLSPSVFEKLAFGHRAEGVVAVADLPARTLGEIKLNAQPLVAVLEGVEKPGNVGAVLRSADGAGVSALIAADGGTDLYNPNAIRASLGTIFTLPVAAASSAETLHWLRAKKLRVFAARVDGAVEYTACDFRGPCAIVLGSEADGLTGAWRGEGITALRLPMRGKVDSLNVAAAAAVLFYEALRQRR